MEASVVSSVASTTVAANAGEDATLEFNEGEGDPNENEKKKVLNNCMVKYQPQGVHGSEG